MRLINFVKFSVIIKLCFLSSIISVSSSEKVKVEEKEPSLNFQRPVYPMESEVIITGTDSRIVFGEPPQLEAIVNANYNVVEILPRPNLITEARNIQGEVVIILPRPYIKFVEELRVEATLNKAKENEAKEDF